MEIVRSLILAIFQSILFYGKTIGISILIFVIIGNGILFYILNRKNKIKNKNGFWLLVPIILLSCTYFIFANTTFYISNVIIIVLLNLLMYGILINQKNYLKNYINNALQLLKNTITGFNEATTFTAKKVKENIKVNEKINKANFKKVAISLLIVFVVVGIVILLLASADSSFASIFENLVNVFADLNIGNTASFVIRIALIVLAYFLMLSFILKINKDYKVHGKEIKSYNNKYAFTMKLLLIALNIVYLVFCYIQIKSLLENLNIKYLSYSHYARTGFFQLMFVSLINFAVILLSNKFNENKEKSIKILNLFLVLFTIIIALSSMFRMYMYQMEFGLTYLRIFVYIILITELLTFIPIIKYIFNEKFDFLKWSLVIWIGVYCIVNYMDMEKIIISYNIGRNSSIREVDYEYIFQIASQDSFDILQEKLEDNNIDFSERLELTKTIQKLASNSNDISWQEFNISKWKVKEKKIDTEALFNEVIELENKVYEEELKKDIVESKLDKSDEDYVYKKVISKDEIYVVELTGAATGVSQWTIGKITDNGTKYTKINTIGVSAPSKIEFFENGLGFLEEPDGIYCPSSKLSITRDSGKTFEEIEFPDGEFTLSDPEGKKWEECYDYFYLPTRDEDGTLTVLVSGGYEGGYNQGKTRAKYISNDNGETWEFVSEVWKEEYSVV